MYYDRQYISVARVRQCNKIGYKGFATYEGSDSGPVSVR